MRTRGSLWRDADFMRLWTAESVSRLGSQVSLLALPLAAITVLHASTFEVGLLSTAEFAPFVLVGLPAGVWVDRLRRRPVLIAGDLGRALALGSIPLAYALDVLSIGQLYAVGFVTGVLTVFFDVAYQSYLPSLVQREQLVEGNAKLEISSSGASIAGPGLGGGLIQLVGPALAVLADAASFLASALFVFLIRRPEPVPERRDRPAGRRGAMRHEIVEGLRYVLGHRLLRWIAATTASANLFSSMITAIAVLYFVRQLHLSPGLIGLVLTTGNLGWSAARGAAGRLARDRPGHRRRDRVGRPRNASDPLGARGRPHPVPDRRAVPGVLRRHRLQHQPAQPASGDHPAEAARPHERDHALHGVGHAAARRRARRCARRRHRAAPDGMDRRGRQPAAGAAGAALVGLAGPQR
jgi:hypothetical protein